MVNNEQCATWEWFHDTTYYHMWCVRRMSDRELGGGFHVMWEEEAKELCGLLNRLQDTNPL